MSPFYPCIYHRLIHVYKLLRQLQKTAPLKNRTVLGVDPGYRTGCKLAVVDETGKVLDTGVAHITLGKGASVE